MLQPVDRPVTHLSTESNLIVGTFPYMSPEQLRAEPLDARSDIYSFGVTLYELCTGQRPHQESQPISLADAILHKQPVPLTKIRQDLSPRLQNIVLKCLEKDPANRYQSAKELVVDLKRLLTPSMFSAVENFTRVPSRPKFKRAALYAAIPLTAILIALAAYFLISRPRSSGPESVGANIKAIVALPSRV
jgi:serine/threonine protein kinase